MVVEIKDTFDSITFVTMCFNLGKAVEKKFNRTNRNYISFYVESVKRVCKAFKNVIVFCDKECADILNAESTLGNAVVVVLKLEELASWKHLEDFKRAFSRMEKEVKIRKKIALPYELLKSGCVVRVGCSEENAVYCACEHAKTYFLEKAVKQNPFDTNYFYWFDGGLTNDMYEYIWGNFDGSIRYRPSGIRMAISISKREIRHWAVAKYLWTTHNLAYGFIPSQAVGGVFGGNRENIVKMAEYFEVISEELLERGLTSIGQGIFTIMIKRYPELFDIPVTCMSYREAINEVFNQEKSIKLWGDNCIKSFDLCESFGNQ